MKINFFLETAGLLISIILWSACSVRYNIIDLKDKIYIKTVRALTWILSWNIIFYGITYSSNIKYSILTHLIVYGNLIFMVWIWYYVINYLLEYIHNENYISFKRKLILGIPIILMIVTIIIDLSKNILFDILVKDQKVNIIFQKEIKYIYIMLIIDIVFYIFVLIKNGKRLFEKKLYAFLILPALMVIAYLLQIYFSNVFILGFTYSLVMLFLYIYEYNRIIKIDNLTQLPNEETFKKMLDYRIALEKNMKIVMITLNNFKVVNYEYGYQNGNKFIKAIAKYLENKAPKNSIARYGGDKYAIIFENYSEEQIKTWCDDILEKFQHSWRVEKLCHKISACITIVDYPTLAQDSNEIVELLEYLNSNAKKYKKNQYIVCTEALRNSLKRRKQINTILNEMIENEELHAFFQPILDVNKNKYTRAEAVIRMEDEELGIISKDEFISIAEENGLINNIGYVLLKRVCVYIKSFLDEGKKPPVISVNFTRQQIMAEDVIKRISNILNEYQLKPEYIAIELSESVFSAQYEDVRVKMMEMHQKGFRFYLDGFGIGLLELSHLLELPFEIVKINKNIIKESENNNSVYLLLSALVAVFEENGKKILGEGIDTENIKNLTDLLFMNYLQGDYYCEPISSKKAKLEFLRENIDDKVKEFNDL